jgi:hypothetical protein
MARNLLRFPELHLGSELRIVFSGSFYDKVEQEAGEYFGVIASVRWTGALVTEVSFTDGSRLSYLGESQDFPSGYSLGNGCKVTYVINV